MTKGESEQNLASYSQSLLNIVRGKALYGGNIDQAFHEITEAAANTLGVERASIWLFADGGNKICCADLYELGPHRHSEGAELTAADYPAYFATMEKNRAIDAHDAHGDPRTCEFSEPYLTPLGITSLLDAPVHFDGRTIGVICHEHIGQARHWNPAEINYAGSLADLISHALEARDRKQAEQKLKSAQDQLGNIISNLPGGIYRRVLRTDGTEYLEYNMGQLPQALGVEARLGESSPKFVSDFVLPEYRKIRDEAVRKSAESMEQCVFEYPIRMPDDSIIWVQSVSTPHRRENGEIVWDGLNLVIAERKQAEEALRENENLLNSIIENVPVGLLIKDSDHVVERANSTYLSWYGFDLDTMKGHRSDEIEDFQSAKEAEFMNAQEREVLSTGTIQTRQLNRPFIDGKIHTINITKFPVYDQQGNITKVGSVSIDLTEQVQANQAKSFFLAAMSHDLRTPLNAIIGFADFINLQSFGPIGEKYQEYAGDIRSSGELLLSLVNDILDLSAIESGRQSLAKENISPIDIVTECEIIIKEKAQFLGVDLVMKVPKDLPPLYANRRAITQILLNLLSNSIKFTAEGGKVTLRVTATNEHHTIEVSDTGMGIPADKISTITDPFVRDEPDPHKTQEGTGLGLAIVKSLVDRHDGELDFKSKVGKGTTVTVTLPNTEA